MSDTPTPIDFTADPHWGKAGRYVVDPVTGRREPVADPDPEPGSGPATEPATDKPTRKGK